MGSLGKELKTAEVVFCLAQVFVGQSIGSLYLATARNLALIIHYSKSKSKGANYQSGCRYLGIRAWLLRRRQLRAVFFLRKGGGFEGARCAALSVFQHCRVAMPDRLKGEVYAGGVLAL